MATVAEVRVASSRRAEAFLLALAVAVVVAAYALAGNGAAGAFPSSTLPYAAGVVVLAVAAHVALRRWAPAADPVLLPVALALNGIGVAMIYRIDLANAATTATHAAQRQLLWSCIGIVGAILVVFVIRDHRSLRRFTYTALIAGLVLLVMPLAPVIGSERNGATVWVQAFGYSFQPAEFAKLALAVFFAGYLVSHRDALTLAGPKMLGIRLPRPRDLGPIIIAWVASVGILVAQTDLGTSLLFFGLFVAMLYVATERASWALIGVGLFLAGAVVAGAIFPHVSARYDTWLHAFDPAVYGRNPGGSGQLVEGLFGLANGGLLGTGLGEGQPNLVPFASSDFIVASLGEELGLAGLMAILALFLVFVQRAMRTAIGTRDGFGKLLAAGLGFTLVLQVFIVVGGVTRIIPLTGLTTPFLAAGGSSLIASWLTVGLLLRISDSARRAEAVAP